MKSIDRLKKSIKQQEEVKVFLFEKLAKLKNEKIKLQEKYNAALLEDVKKSDTILLEIKGVSVEIETINEQLSALEKENPALKNIGKEIYKEGYTLTQDLKKELITVSDSFEILKDTYENETRELRKKENELILKIDDISENVFNYKKYMDFIPGTVRTPIQLNLKNINLLEVEERE